MPAARRAVRGGMSGIGGRPCRRRVQVEAGPADDDGRPALATGLGQDREPGLQPAGDGRLLVGGEQAVQAMREARRFRPARAGGENRQIPEQLLAVGVDDDAVEPTRQGHGEGGLAARGAATYDDQRLDTTSPRHRSRDAGRRVPDRRPRAASARPTARGRGGQHPRRRGPLARRSTGGRDHQPTRSIPTARRTPPRHAGRGCTRRPSGTAGGSSSQAAAAVRHGQHHHHHRVHRRAGRLRRASSRRSPRSRGAP